MAPLDMSLDDMIKTRRNSKRGRGQGRTSHGRGPIGSIRGGRLTGAPRRGPLGVNARPSAYTIAKSYRGIKSLPWQHDLFEDSLRAAGLSGLEFSTKLYISNLDIGVTNEDIRELFTEIGVLKRYALHYDKNGRPSGSAEVVYVRRSDAFQARKRYNNVQLDGKPMKIEIVGANSEIPVSASVNVVGGLNGRKRTFRMTPGGPGPARGRGGGVAANQSSGQMSRGGLSNRRGRGRGGLGRVGSGRGRGRGGRGRVGSGHGRGRGKAVDKSADELDKELDNYHAEAMQT